MPISESIEKMKNIVVKWILAFSLVMGGMAYAQNSAEKVNAEKAKLPKPYKPEENAEQKLKELMERAKKEKKNIILQAGGNWCIWCLRFDNFVNTTPEIKRIVDENYLYYHLNYSKENKNEAVFAKYGDPGKKHGYPVFIVIDAAGKLLHIQESGSLEADKSYDVDKVAHFFSQWKPKK